MGYSPWIHKETDTTERLTHNLSSAFLQHFPFLLIIPPSSKQLGHI